MLFQFTNGGRPVLEVIDANYDNRGELLLSHQHVGVDLRWDWAQETLTEMTRLWRRPVLVETIRGGEPVRLKADGDEISEEKIDSPASPTNAS